MVLARKREIGAWVLPRKRKKTVGNNPDSQLRFQEAHNLEVGTQQRGSEP